MAFNLHNRHLLNLWQHTPQEIQFLVNLGRDLKRARYAGTEQQRLRGKVMALIFEKSSTRTRCAFEVAAHQQGAHVTYLEPGTSQLGYKESVRDTARVLGRMYDALAYRGADQTTVEELAAYAGVPVFNGLTDDYHPTQMLADALTMSEHSAGPLRDISYAYLGDARNNMARSLLLLGAKLGMGVRLGAPKALWPDQQLVARCRQLAEQTGACIHLTEVPEEAVHGVDFIHTDVWVSMGEPIQAWGERVDALLPYQVNQTLLAAADNPRVKFMHCLPAFHNVQTSLGQQICSQYPQLADGIEVTEDVFESSANIAFEQAENRLHTIKAVLVSSLRDI